MMNYFRSKPVAVAPNADESKSLLTGVPSGNMFAKGSKFDLHIYLAELDRFIDFDNEKALFFSSSNIDYGDWYMGDDKDGVISFSGNFDLTTVKNIIVFVLLQLQLRLCFYNMFIHLSKCKTTDRSTCMYL